MNWLDLVILLIVVVSAIMGLKIGMIRATLAIIVGNVLAVQLTGRHQRTIGGCRRRQRRRDHYLLHRCYLPVHGGCCHCICDSY